MKYFLKQMVFFVIFSLIIPLTAVYFGEIFAQARRIFAAAASL